MVKTSSVDKKGLRKGPWSEEEDNKLRAYVLRYGHWNWRQLPKFAGVSRCGKSCRLRWYNYLKPGVRRGNYTAEEEELIIKLHEQYGNRWSAIAAKLPGRTDNDIKNHWHTNLRKKNKQNQSTETERSQQMEDADQNEQSSAASSSKPTHDLMREMEYSNNIVAAHDSFAASMDISSLSCDSVSHFGCVERPANSVESVLNEPFESFCTEPFALDTSLNNHMTSSNPWLEEDLMYPFSSFLDDSVAWLHEFKQ